MPKTSVRALQDEYGVSNSDITLAIYRLHGFYTKKYFNDEEPETYRKSRERFERSGIKIVLRDACQIR